MGAVERGARLIFLQLASRVTSSESGGFGLGGTPVSTSLSSPSKIGLLFLAVQPTPGQTTMRWNGRRFGDAPNISPIHLVLSTFDNI